jgi:hypothetical protein
MREKCCFPGISRGAVAGDGVLAMQKVKGSVPRNPRPMRSCSRSVRGLMTSALTSDRSTAVPPRA